MKTNPSHEPRPARRVLKLLALTTLVLAGAGLYAQRRGASVKASTSAVAVSRATSDAAPAPALDRRLDNADLRLRMLSAQVAALSSSAAAAGPTEPKAASAEREDPSSAPPASPEDLSDYHEKQGALLNQTIEHGARDDWSRSKQLELTTSFSEMLSAHSELDMTLDAVDCVATLCRLRLAPRGEMDARATLGTLTTQMAWPGERYYKVVPGDHPSVTIYAAREGAELPRVAMADSAAEAPE